jgi:hypothetical protein
MQQRGVDSHWPAVRGTRFVAPARSGRGRPLLSRAIVRITPCSPRATLDAARREPLRAMRLSARSSRVAGPVMRRGATRRLPAGSSMRMTAPRASRRSEAPPGLTSPRLPDPRPWPG